MSLTNKLGRTVSYSVLLAGVLAAGSALAEEPAAGSADNPLTKLESTVDLTSDKYFKGDVVLDNSEGGQQNVTASGSGKLNIMEGSNITISGTHKVGEEEARNSINGYPSGGETPSESGIVFEKGMGNVKITDGGSIEFDTVEINGGNFELSGKGEALKTAEGQEWRKGSLIGAESSLTMTDGNVSLSDGAVITAGKINMTGGEINLNGGDSVLRAHNTNSDNDNKIIVSNAKINVTGKNYIAADDGFELKKGSELNLKNAVLDLVRNMPESKSDTPKAAAVANFAGNIVADNSTINGSITLDGTEAVNAAVAGLETNEEKLAAALKAAPQANFNGNNIVNGAISNTEGIVNVSSGTLTVNEDENAGITNNGYSIISVADGATLKADEITNNANGYVNVAGTIDGTITNSGTVTAAGSNAHISQLNGGELNISANTSSSKLFSTEESKTSDVDLVYVSSGNEFTLDNENFSAEKYVTYGKLALAQNVEGAAKIGNGGTIDLGSNTLTGDVAAWNNSALAFNVDQTADTESSREQAGGKIKGNLKIHQNEGETLTIKPTIALGVENGTYDYASSVANGETNDFESLTLSQDNMLYDVAFADDAKQTLNIEKKDSSAVSNEVAAAGGNANDASLINAWVGGNARAFAEGSAAEDMANHLNTLAQSNPKAAVAAAQALAPEANPVVNTQVTENARQIFNVAGSRLDGATRGMASGDSMIKKAGMWVQGLFNKSKLDKHNGFDVDSEGIAFGADGYVNENVKLGAGYAYTESDIDSVGRKTDADTNTGFVYGEYNAPSYYVNAVASYSKGDYKEKKHVAGKLVRASYDVDSIALQTIYGYKMGDFSPEAGLRYINAKQDAYTDTAGQHVGSNSSDTLTAILGGRYAKDIKAGDYTLRPEVKLAATYDLMRDKNSTAVTLANGAGYMVRGENLKRFGIEAGAGLSMAVSDNVKVGLNYEGRFKKDYTDHTGILEARYNF